MKSAFDISVVIPVFNAEMTLRATVDSVLTQSGPSCEIILVDDGSTDASAAVCDSLSESYPQVRVVHTENRGVSAARNTGIAAATGEYVMFMDADDLLKDEALKSLYIPDQDFVVAGFEKVTASSVVKFLPDMSEAYEGTESICDFFDMMIKEEQCYLLNSPCFKLFRRSLIAEKSISFVEGLSYAEDKIFVMSFLYHASKVHTVAQVVYSYMIQEESLSSDMTSDRHLEQVFRLLREYEPLLARLTSRYGESSMLAGLYHTDLVSRYVCRILTAFLLKPSALAVSDNIRQLYAYMDADSHLGLFSIRAGQIPNLILYRLGNPPFSERVYALTSSICSFFSKD